MAEDRWASVYGDRMHYIEAGAGAPILFLHGNPTSSELWRRVMPFLADDGRCLAPDLIGMGRSTKPTIGYRFEDHAVYLDGFIQAMSLNDIIFVAHDWGVALAADYLARHASGVCAFAFMEGRLEPLRGWDAFDEGGRSLFQSFRTPGMGERLILDENMLLDVILQAGTERRLSSNELQAFREPFPDPASRLPLLQWTREIPVAGEPEDVAVRMAAGFEALAVSEIPKLAIHASPGAVVDSAMISRWAERLPNFQAKHVGRGTHFLPLDRPEEIGRALHNWLRSWG